MKKWIALSLSLLLLLSGCAAAPEVDVTALTDTLMEHASFDETPSELERDVIAWRYGVSDDVEARVFVAGSTAEELCVMKAPDEKAAEAVFDLLSDHLAEMKDSYANYQPAEVTRLETAQLRRVGTCVVLLVSADERPAEVLDEYWK